MKVTEDQYLLLTNRAKIQSILYLMGNLIFSNFDDPESNDLTKAYNLIVNALEKLDTKYEIGEL